MEVNDGWGKTREEVEVESGGQNAPFSFRARRACLQSCVLFCFGIFATIQRKEWGRSLPRTFKVSN